MKKKLHSLLEPYGQQHLLRFWDELDTGQQQHLAEQIETLDLERVQRLYRERGDEVDWKSLAARAEGPPAVRLAGDTGERREEAKSRGAEALRAGKVGAILVAGGQGTRLRHDGPKGTYEIGPVSGASLYQILCEKIAATARRYETPISLYLMTSPATDRETKDFLARHDRFGLPAGDLRIFCQAAMPAVDAETGRILLADKGEIALSPDGHGGMLAAFARSGCLADVAQRGIEQLFYFQVDNPLAPVCDPAILGYHIGAGSEMTTLVVAKQEPEERVGNVVAIDGRVQIIEYSDLPREAAERRRPDGSLELWAGNTAIHVFDAVFLARQAEANDSLPFHVAHKPVPYVNERGEHIDPREETVQMPSGPKQQQVKNALKFEKFIFDLLPSARQPLVVEVRPEEAFAPLKNAPGEKTDTPEIVRAAMIDLNRRWLEAAGATAEPDTPVEISPLFALDDEQLAEKVDRGQVVDRPTYFR